jgi:hypothetical protein
MLDVVAAAPMPVAPVESGHPDRVGAAGSRLIQLLLRLRLPSLLILVLFHHPCYQ